MEIKNVKLNELTVNGKGSYGIAASAVEPQDDLFTYLRITDINDNGTLNKSGLKCVDDPEAEKYLLEPNDIVFARTGASTGRNYFYDGTDGRFVYAGFLIKFSIDPQKVNPYYIKYYCLSDQYKNWVASFSTGSTRGNINAQTFGNMPLPIPPRQQQDYLVSVLQPIDEKIAKNQAINDNLQSLMLETFRAWYIDFIPFQNVRFESSEFGKVPLGWNFKRLGELCDSISFTHSFDKPKLIFLNTGDVEEGIFLHSNYSDVDTMPGQAKKTISPGDILYSEIRPINKHYAYVTQITDDYIVSTKFMVIRANNFDSRRIYHFLTLPETIRELQTQAESRSGTFPQIRFDNISRLPILVATPEIENQFCNFLHTIYAKIDANIAENQRLAELRDALLPRLMSGELDVSEVDI